MEVSNPSQKSAEAKLPERIEKCINNVIKKESFVNYNITSKLLPADGGSYLSERYEISIKGQTENEEKELNIFVKNNLSVGEGLSGFINMSTAFTVECIFYKELAKIIAKLEIDANVPIDERFKSVKSYEESNPEMILLENLSKKGFKCFERKKMVPLKFFELGLSQIAKLHAMVFIIQNKTPEIFNEKIELLPYAVSYNEYLQNFFADLAKTALRSLSDDKKLKAKNMLQIAIENYNKGLRDKSFSVLCHGDFRVDNILIREENGQVQELIPIDYQMMHYGNPAKDLLNLLYCCNDTEFRKQHMKHLIEFYYTSVGKYLKYFDIDISDVYPRKSLADSLKARQDIGVVISLCFYPIFFASADNAPKIGHKEIEDHKLDASVVKKIEEVLDEVSELVGSSNSIWE